MKKYLLAIIFLVLTPICVVAQIKQIPLYPVGVPNSKPTPQKYIELDVNEHALNVSKPTIVPFIPKSSGKPSAAVIICPGGGYSGLAIEKEGYKVARKFNEIGIAAFVLKYRLPDSSIMIDKSIGPLQDAQRAIQLVRINAEEWNIDPHKIGIMGFSAGGHLASSAGTHFDTCFIENRLKISLRPDFMLLVYPVITFGKYANRVTEYNLLGKNPPKTAVEFFSNELHVNKETPPVFLVQAEDDGTVPVQNSIVFYEQLLKNNVAVEMHLYQAGGHGFGLDNSTTKDQWFERCINFLTENHFI